MKKILITIIIFTAAIRSEAQNESYRGGAADGHALLESLTPFGFPAHFTPYLSGSNDGYAGSELVNGIFPFPDHFYVYLGGANDGWAGMLQPGVIIVPISLLQFRGEEINGMNRLHWITEQEINSSHFVIERSADGIDFNSIGREIARGTYSGRSHYQKVDSLPLPGKNYYRLKMIDRDSSFKISPVILMERKDKMFTMLIYPNPVKGMLRIRFSRPVPWHITWTIRDAMGRQVLRQQTAGDQTQYGLDVSRYPAGVYVLEAGFGEEKEIVQFTKQ